MVYTSGGGAFCSLTGFTFGGAFLLTFFFSGFPPPTILSASPLPSLDECATVELLFSTTSEGVLGDFTDLVLGPFGAFTALGSDAFFILF